MPSGIRETVGSTLAIAAVSTLGDWVWAAWVPGHRVVYGMTHGALLFLAIGLVLGLWAGRAGFGAVAGAATGLLATACFYVLAPAIGFVVAMLAVWFAMWLGLAALDGLIRRRVRAVAVVGRGLAAGALSGFGFYLISGIWMPFDPAGWDYLVHFGSWNAAFLPGFAALLIRTGEAS